MEEYYDPDLEFEDRATRKQRTRQKRPVPPAVRIDPAQVQHYMDIQRSEAHLPLGVMAGLIGASVGGTLWFGVTALTSFQVGWMAIGVGLIAGSMVRVAGRGIDRVFGITGALLTIFGCALGSFLSGCWFVAAETQGAGFVELLAKMTPGLAIEILKAMAAPMNLIFAGVAIFAAYWISLRRNGREELEAMAFTGTLPGQPGSPAA